MNRNKIARHELVCDYCKLPVPGWRGAQVDWGDDPVYCCLGCRVAAAIASEPSEHVAPRALLAKLGLAIFCTMNVMAFTMALWTRDLYGPVDANTNLSKSLDGLFRYIVLLFSLPVFYTLGMPLCEQAIAGLRRRSLSADFLLALGVSAAFFWSFLSVLRGEGPIYFEVGCVILVMTTLGRWLEATAKVKANAALDALVQLLPATVRRVREGVEQSIPLDDVQVDDLLRVLPGERFPADGRLAQGRCFVDEHVLTGESKPVLREPGDRVVGGGMNLDGDVAVLVTAAPASGTLARLLDLVREARESKGYYQRLADRAASRFIPLVSTLVVATFLVHATQGSLERGFWSALAVALIACPCALGLAAPLAVSSALGNAASQGVLFRGGEALEQLAEIVAIRFDKTGTLTTGSAEVACFLTESPEHEEQTLALAARLASASSHPLSLAIVDFASSRKILPCPDLSEIRAVPGLGLTGAHGSGKGQILLGSQRYLLDQGYETGPVLDAAARAALELGLPLVMLGWQGWVRGLFVFEEQWRDRAPQVVQYLASEGLDVAVLTGDGVERGPTIEQFLGVPVRAGLLPDQKIQAIVETQAAVGPVCMVGDGLNDSPALAASDVGIALGCGTDVSRDAASVCLLGDDLSRIPWSLELARRTRRTIRWNLAWAFGYNSAGILFAAVGWLNPAIAAFLMAVSSAFVTIHSLSLSRSFEVELPQRHAITPGSRPAPAPLARPFSPGLSPQDQARPARAPLAETA